MAGERKGQLRRPLKFRSRTSVKAAPTLRDQPEQRCGGREPAASGRSASTAVWLWESALRNRTAVEIWCGAPWKVEAMGL